MGDTSPTSPATGRTLQPQPIPDWMEEEVQEYALPFNVPPKSVLDIGANIGAFTLLAARLWPDAVIRAYEPVPENAQGWMRHCASLHNAFLVTAAVRASFGQQFIFKGEHGATASFHDLGRQTRERIPVCCVSASSIASYEYVKIDTEGCEVEILDRLDLSKTLAISVEYHRTEDVQQLERIAKATGFDLIKENQLWENGGILIFAKPGVLKKTEGRVTRVPKLFLALPVYNSLEVHFAQSLIKLIANPPIEMMVRMNPGDSLVSRARNSLTAQFLESDATHLMFIDTDLIFSAEHVARLMSHPEPIVAGFYPKKQEGETQWVCNACFEQTPVLPSGLQRVRYMGTGFLRIAREVFERMIEAHPELAYHPDHSPEKTEYDFWSVGIYRDRKDELPESQTKIKPGRYLSEDWFFCQRAIDLGYEVWGDTGVLLKHVGQAIYPLQSQQQKLFAGLKTGEPETSADVHRPASAEAPQLSEGQVTRVPVIAG